MGLQNTKLNTDLDTNTLGLQNIDKMIHGECVKDAVNHSIKKTVFLRTSRSLE